MGFLEDYKKNHTHPVNKALHTVGIPLIVIAIIWFFLAWLFYSLAHWPWILALFIFGWILQFIGHGFEKTWPSFFKTPIYLLVGPIWWVLKVLGLDPKNKGDQKKPPSSNA